jgi:hypothetical protein
MCSSSVRLFRSFLIVNHRLDRISQVSKAKKKRKPIAFQIDQLDCSIDLQRVQLVHFYHFRSDPIFSTKKTARSDQYTSSQARPDRSIQKKNKKSSATTLAQGRRLSAPRREPSLACASLARLSVETVWGRAPPLARPRKSSGVQRQFGPRQFRPNFRTVKKKKKK